MGHSHDEDHKGTGISRRHALECMIWAGTGVLWTVVGGVPVSTGLLSSAEAAIASFNVSNACGLAALSNPT